MPLVPFLAKWHATKIKELLVMLLSKVLGLETTLEINEGYEREKRGLFNVKY